jgi:hypothetical protein
MRAKTYGGLLAVGLLLGSAPAFADIRTEGRELRVNTRSDFRQVDPAVAYGRNGVALVAWENDQAGIRGQFYDASGQPRGAELTLVQSDMPPPGGPLQTVFKRRDPAIAFLANGRFLLAWTEERNLMRWEPFFERREVQDQDIYVQRFSAAGSPLAEKVRVNVATAGMQREPLLAALPTGFVAVWDDAASGRIVGRMIGSDGNPTGSDIQISTAPGKRPALAAAGRRVLVVWDGEDGDGLGVFARLLDPTGSPIGAPFRVNETTADLQMRPRAAADARGNFFVAWQSEHPEIYPFFYYLYGRAVGSEGGLLSTEKRLYSGSLGQDRPQISPSLSATADGRFLLSWLTWTTVNPANTPLMAAGVELDAQGNATGPGFWLSESRVERNFRELGVASDENGRLMVVWESSGKRGPSITARRLSTR